MFIDTLKAQAVEQFMYKVYGWMFVGLLTTAGSAYWLFQEPVALKFLLGSQYSFLALVGVQLGLIIYLQSCLTTLSYQRAGILFLLYSVLVGFTLAPIFLVYTMASVAQTFVVTAGMFGSMALYGFFTRTDLSKYGNMLLMGLFGLIIAQVSNMFFASSQFDFYLSLFGVLLFTALTAYDVQKLKRLAADLAFTSDEQMGSKIALMGALTLYLDFLNLFLRLLKIMGKRRR